MSSRVESAATSLLKLRATRVPHENHSVKGATLEQSFIVRGKAYWSRMHAFVPVPGISGSSIALDRKDYWRTQIQ